MKKSITFRLTFLFVILFSVASPAQRIWIQGPGASKIEFQDFLKQQSSGISYSKFIAEKLQPEPLEDSFLSWGQNVLDRHPVQDTLFSEMESFENSQIMHQGKRLFLVDLLGKVNEKADAKMKKNIASAICKWSALSPELKERSTVANQCPRKSLSVHEFMVKFPQADLLYIEDVLFNLQAQAFLPVDAKTNYNWKIISNSSSVISFRGSFQDLLQQKLHFIPLLDGTCDSFTHNQSDIELISAGSVYFSSDCQKTLQDMETSGASRWYEKNKSWVIPVGIAVLAASAYHLRDKKLVIEKPDFR